MITKSEIEELILKLEIKQEDLISTKRKIEEDHKSNYNGEKLEKLLYIIDDINMNDVGIKILYSSLDEYDEIKLKELKKDLKNQNPKIEKKIKKEYNAAKFFEDDLDKIVDESGRTEKEIFENITDLEYQVRKNEYVIQVVSQVLKNKRIPKNGDIILSPDNSDQILETESEQVEVSTNLN